MKKVALVLFAIGGIVHIIFGIVYLTADQFMPYHAQALSTDWNGLNNNFQTLILASMNLAGAGGLVTGIVNLSLVSVLFRQTSHKLAWLLPLTTLIFQMAINYVVYCVYNNTPGEPPLAFVSIATGFFILATIMLFLGIRREHT